MRNVTASAATLVRIPRTPPSHSILECDLKLPGRRQALRGERPCSFLSNLTLPGVGARRGPRLGCGAGSNFAFRDRENLGAEGIRNPDLPPPPAGAHVGASVPALPPWQQPIIAG